MPIKNVFRVAIITILILLIPLGLQLTIGTGVDGQGWNWTLSDFVIVGVILFIFGLVINVVVRRAGRYRALWAAGVVLLFLWLYAELAVGIFTNWGS